MDIFCFISLSKMLVALGAQVLKFFQQVGKIFGTKICDKNILFVRIFWCLILFQEFFSGLVLWNKKKLILQKLVMIGWPIFIRIIGQVFSERNAWTFCKQNVLIWDFIWKIVCVKFCRNHFEKFLEFFVKSDGSVKHSTLEFCSKNLWLYLYHLMLKFLLQIQLWKKKIELVQNLQQFNFWFWNFWQICGSKIWVQMVGTKIFCKKNLSKSWDDF